MEIKANGETKRALADILQSLRWRDIKVVEIGCWKGNITRFFAKIAREVGGKVFAVDHWEGVKGESYYEEAQTSDVYKKFIDYLQFGDEGTNDYKNDIRRWVCPMVMSSEEATKIFEDGILDLVFIDGDHRYPGIKADLVDWLPKIKKGGIICGHDCEGKYSQYPKEIQEYIKKDCNKPFSDISPRHPGVVKALFDVFGDDYKIVPNSVVWWKQL